MNILERLVAGAKKRGLNPLKAILGAGGVTAAVYQMEGKSLLPQSPAAAPRLTPPAPPQSAVSHSPGVQARVQELETANTAAQAANTAQAAEVTRLTGELTTAQAATVKAQADLTAANAKAENRAQARAIEIVAAAGGAPIISFGKPGKNSNPAASHTAQAAAGLKGIERARAAIKIQIEKANNQ